MRLTRSVGYAVGILLRVQNHRANGPMTAAAIADGCEFPPRFLYRVLRRMVDAGIMTGISGPGGGYALARPVRDITLLDVVHAVEGQLMPTQLEPVQRRQKKAIDALNDLCARNADAFSKELAKVSLSKLIEV